MMQALLIALQMLLTMPEVSAKVLNLHSVVEVITVLADAKIVWLYCYELVTLTVAFLV